MKKNRSQFQWKKVQAFALLLAITLLAAGCATQQSRSVAVQLDFASQPTVYVNTFIERNAPQVFVYPTASPENPPKALFYPLTLVQRMENASVVGQGISRIVWQTWLQEQVFPVLEFAQIKETYTPERALALGRVMGADVVVGGYITHLIDGGTAGNSEASLSLEIYDVPSGNMIWSMGSGGFIQKDKVSDYLLFAVKAKMPSDPLAAVITTLSADMGRVVSNWAEPKGPEKPWHGYEPNAF